MAVCIVCLVTFTFAILLIERQNGLANHLCVLVLRNSCPFVCVTRTDAALNNISVQIKERRTCIHHPGCNRNFNLTKKPARLLIHPLYIFAFVILLL